MKRLVRVVAVVFFLSWSCFAQTSPDDSPATKADVERYFQAVQSHDMMKKMMAPPAKVAKGKATAKTPAKAPAKGTTKKK